MKTIVSITRKWDRPEIETTVWRKGEDLEGKYVEIKMDLPPFIDALIEEINIEAIKTALKDSVGSVTMVFTRAAIEKRIDDAVDAIGLSGKIDRAVEKIVAGMKEEWVKHPD
jgi:hypothetical protein